jgi:DNA-binding Xre family transcriptional regulator
MLTLQLAPIFKARGIERPFSFLVKAGLSRHAATRLLNGKPSVLRLDHLELLCRVLICDPHDLLVFTPENDQQYLPDHPLFKLKQKEPVGNLQQAIASMPYNQLKEVTKNILSGGQDVSKL